MIEAVHFSQHSLPYYFVCNARRMMDGDSDGPTTQWGQQQGRCHTHPSAGCLSSGTFTHTQPPSPPPLREGRWRCACARTGFTTTGGGPARCCNSAGGCMARWGLGSSGLLSRILPTATDDERRWPQPPPAKMATRHAHMSAPSHANVQARPPPSRPRRVRGGAARWGVSLGIRVDCGLPKLACLQPLDPSQEAEEASVPLLCVPSDHRRGLEPLPSRPGCTGVAGWAW